MDRPERRARAAGFSLIELLVAMAVMLFALLLACDLLDESARVLHHSMRRARDPLPLLATELLRNDVRGALPQAGGPAGWDPGPLVLEVPGTGQVVWERRRDELWRREGGAERPRLGRVAGWRWQALPRGAVEVRLELAESGTWLTHSRAGVPLRDAGRREVIRILVASRGGQDGW